MKILEIRLFAYGPFTDKFIDLSGGNQGLHIMYGPNEAGKSSALRALRDLFYGIPERSADNFLHPYSRMRIGAAIQSGNGETLQFVRRKGRGNTLRCEDDQTVMEESLLGRFLNGVDADLFRTMFGIDHDNLVRGGKEIVMGGGSMGRLLFAAGSGVSNLREVQEQLKFEAEALFKPSAKKPQINEILSSINKNRKDMRAAQLSGQEWVNHDRTLIQTLERKKIIEGDLLKKKRDLRRLERISEALPLIAKRKDLFNELKIYVNVVILPEGFQEQRSAMLTQLRVAENDRDQALKSMEFVEKEILELKISGNLLENAKLIEEIYRESGSQRKAAKDSISLQTRMSVLRGEASEILRSLQNDLSIDDAEALRIKKTEAVRIQTSGAKFERIITLIEAVRQAIPKLKKRINGIDNQLEKLGVPRQIQSLKNAVSRAEEYGVLEKHYCTEQNEISVALKELHVEFARQILRPGQVESLESLPVPSIDTISMFEEKTGKTDLNYNSLQNDYEKLESMLADVVRQIEELRLKQEVPTEEDLQTAREKRDRGWPFIVSIIRGNPLPDEEINDYVKDIPLSETLLEAFKISIVRADEISDRLRREADRVATKAKLIADRASCEKQRKLLNTKLDIAEKEKKDIAQDWAQLWHSAEIMPRSPREMKEWAQNHMALSAKAKEIRERKTGNDALNEEIYAHCKELKGCMDRFAESVGGNKETLADLIKRSKKIIGIEDELCRKRDRLTDEKSRRQEELAEAEAKVEACEKELLQWKKEWEQAVKLIGLDADAVPAQANAVMEELKTLFAKLKEADILQQRIEGINQDADEFAVKVSEIVDAVAKDLADLSAQEATLKLNGRLTLVRKAQSELQVLQKQLDKEHRRINKAVSEITGIENRLKGMCLDAGCKTYEELPEAEKKSVKRKDLEAELKGLDERLHGLSGGAGIDDFIREALQIDPDSIGGEVDRFSEETDALNQEKSILDQTIGEERNELKKMDGSARAVEFAEDIQILLGRLENDVEQYARLKIAAKILSLAIERYRDKSQGPVLQRTSDFFKLITHGSFEGIRADFDGDGHPVLVGVRPGGREIVGVSGMSDGTADQLYLALRMAGLQDYLKNNEPIPFIVDDILIKFDDDRAIAGIKGLARLSEQTQVIFFTHHRHLLDLVEKNIEPSAFIKHTL